MTRTPAAASATSDGRLAAAAAALVAGLAAAIAYRDVLHAYFWNDDFAWLFLLHDRGLVEFLLTPIGGHTCVARNAVMAVLDRLAGLDPAPWFASVLATHALNAALLAALVWLTTGRAALAAAAAVAWGTCPVAERTLDWYAVYGQVAATTCMLLVVARLAIRAKADRPWSDADLAWAAAWLALAAVFFGTAVALACVWPAVAMLLVPAGRRDRAGAVRLLAVTALALAAYAVPQVLARRLLDARIFGPGALAFFAERPWTAVAAFADLVRVGASSLLLGAWRAPGPATDAVGWLLLAVVLALLGVGAARAPSRRRGAIAACALVWLACYALVAVARAPMADALFGHGPDAIGMEGRYHYVPAAFLAAALALAVDAAFRRAALVAVAWAALLLAGHACHGVTVDRHDASRDEVARALATIRAAVAAVPPGGVAYVPNAGVDAFGWMPDTTQRPPGLAALFVIAFPGDRLDGRTVRFVEPDAERVAHARSRGGRIATVLVGPATRDTGPAAR